MLEHKNNKIKNVLHKTKNNDAMTFLQGNVPNFFTTREKNFGCSVPSERNYKGTTLTHSSHRYCITEFFR